ncbi:hypothetical protein FHW83_005714 [Duganella sp. SG902]|nr:hypothetical protein [Duganella sp. SG902]
MWELLGIVGVVLSIAVKILYVQIGGDAGEQRED